MVKRTFVFLAAASAWIASPAAAYTCGGSDPVGRILTYQNGGVLVYTAWRGDFFQICSLTTEWKGVSTATCFAWMSQIASAISSGKPTTFYYDSFDTDFCTTIPSYGNAPPPVYVDIAK